MTMYNNAFFDLLHQVELPSSAQYHSVLETVMTRPTLTQFDEETQQRLFLDCNDVTTRLKLFLGNLNRGKMNDKIADEIILNILLPMISFASSELAPPETVIDLLSYALPSVLGCSNRKQDAILEALSEAHGLLERLITDPKDSQIIKDWISKHEYSARASSMLRAFTQRFMTLCDTCPSDHGTSMLSEQWQNLLKLIDALEQHKLTYEHDQARSHGKLRDTRHLGGSRLLEEFDKKTGIGQSSLPTPFPQVSFDVSQSLALFELVIPSSLRTMETVLEQLKIHKTLELLSSAMETFPCRPCNMSACYPDRSKQSFPAEINRSQLTEQSFDPEIFARRIGIWKVLLSAQAVKDLRGWSHSGTSTKLPLQVHIY